MATWRTSIMPGPGTIPDTTGECFVQPVDVALTLTSHPGSDLVYTLKDPSADNGFYGRFTVPPNYVNTASIVVVGLLDGTTGATTVSFGFSYRAHTDNEAYDQAWAQTLLFDSPTTSGYSDEDVVVKVDTGLTDANFAANDIVPYYFFRDQSQEVSGGFVGDFHVLDLYFQYADA